MFEMRSSALLLLALTIPLSLGAQDAPALQRRLRAAEALRREAAARLEHAQRTRRERLDTVRVGALAVTTRPALLPLVRRATAIAWAQLDSLLGDRAGDIAGEPLLFFLQGQPIRDRAPDVAGLQRVMAGQLATPDDAAFQLVRAAGRALRVKTDSQLATWLGPLLLQQVPAEVVRPRIYVELVTAPSIAVRGCYAGDTGACAVALGLVNTDPLLVWYDAIERQALARRAQDDIRRRGAYASLDACLQSNSDPACIDALKVLPAIDLPLSYDARHDLVRVASAAGGRGAFARLSQTERRQPLQRRLELAAGLPIDSLVQRWRAEVLAARPRPVTLTAPIGWAALIWCVAFGLLALRSTRWR